MLNAIKDNKIKLVSCFLALVFIVSLVFLILVPIKTASTLGTNMVGLYGLSKEDIAFIENINPKILNSIQEAGGTEAVYAAFDCSSMPPAERRPGYNCIEGLLARSKGEGSSPIPERANYLIPIWKAAGKKYNIPWQVLAAVNAVRTNFGQWNCEDSIGKGFMKQATNKYSVNAGSTPLVQGVDGCFDVHPDVINSKDSFYSSKKQNNKKRFVIYDSETVSKNSLSAKPEKGANPYDPVDAIFTQANMMAQSGAYGNKKWKYSGSDSNLCTTPASEGEVYYVPTFGLEGYGIGAKMGYNKNLVLNRAIVQLAAKYRSNKGKYKPRRDDDPSDAKIGDHRIPKKHLVKMLTAAWEAFGARGAELNRNVSLNYKQIGLESGGRPYIMQGHIGDVNDNNPAGGLFQFIPGTFEHWKVDGFNDRFNPIDNMLATVNAQVNGPYKILDGASGWSPPSSHNPYATGGKVTILGANEIGKGKKVNEFPYKGKKQIDSVSKAVAFNGKGTNSPCYTAVVHDWYKAIMENPPEEGIGGPFRKRIIAIARAELKKNVHETGSDNVPRYHPNNKIAPYSISAAWCQSFAAHVWYWAGAKQLNKLGGMTAHDGLTVPSYTGAMTAAAEDNPKLYGKVKQDNPIPGDFAMYGTTHVEIVEKVQGGKVVATIGGNTSDSVMRHPSPSGITHFIEPPTKYGRSSYKGKLPSVSDISFDSFNKINKKIGPLSVMAINMHKDNTNSFFYGSDQASKISNEEFALILSVLAIKSKKDKAKILKYLKTNSVNKLKRSIGTNFFISKMMNKLFRDADDRKTFANKNTPGKTLWGDFARGQFIKALYNAKLLNKSDSQDIVDTLTEKEKSETGLGNFSPEFLITVKYRNKIRQTGIVNIDSDFWIVSISAPRKSISKASKWINDQLRGAQTVSGNAESSNNITLSSNRKGKLLLKAKTTWFSGSMTAAGSDWSADDDIGVALNLKPGTDKGWNNSTTDKWMRAARDGRPYYVRIVNKHMKNKSIIVPIIDKGPAGWTNNGVDLTRGALIQMGYPEGNLNSFPSGTISKVYMLGQNITGKKTKDNQNKKINTQNPSYD